MSTCNSCKKGFKEKQQIISCCICLKLFHADQKCTGTSPTEERVIQLRSDRKLLFRCKECENTGFTGESFQDIVNDIHMQVDKFTEICKNIDASVEKFKDIELKLGKLVELAPKVDDLELRMKKIESTKYESKIINEINERQWKSKNIIIHKLKESDDEGDLAFVLDLFQDAPSEFSITSDTIKIKRLGLLDKKKPDSRPLRVRLQSVELVSWIFSKYKEKNKEISISNDNTKMQSDYYKEVKAELQKQLLDGKKDLVIKHRNGIPTIVKKREDDNPQTSTPRSTPKND